MNAPIRLTRGLSTGRKHKFETWHYGFDVRRADGSEAKICGQLSREMSACSREEAIAAVEAKRDAMATSVPPGGYMSRKLRDLARECDRDSVERDMADALAIREGFYDDEERVTTEGQCQ